MSGNIGKTLCLLPVIYSLLFIAVQVKRIFLFRIIQKNYSTT